MTTPAITADSVVDHLRHRGIACSDDCVVVPMTGGVSGTVILVHSSIGPVIVKQALGKLRVAGDWFANTARSGTEAAALRTLHDLTPDHVPELLDASDSDSAVIMTAAPGDWRTWKSSLMESGLGERRPWSTAALLGRVLGTWHRETAAEASVRERFSDDEAFEQLRLAPFHRTILRRHPQLSDAIDACISDLADRRECLVHGDFSPKNILIDPHDPERVWVLDFEVARVGAAVFDLAFLHCHLLLKAMHQPGSAELYSRSALAFQYAYLATVSSAGAADAVRRLSWQIGCLLLARVDGLSPADYLTESERHVVRGFAGTLLSAPDQTLSELWAALIDRHLESDRQPASDRLRASTRHLTSGPFRVD